MTTDLYAWRASNLGARLYAARDRCVADELATLRLAGFVVSPAQLSLLHQLPAAGASPGALAVAAGLARPSVTEAAARLAAAGWVAITADARDRRGRLVLPTAAGAALLEALAGAAAATDSRLHATSAADARAALTAYAGADHAAVNSLLDRAARRFVSEVLEALARGGDQAAEPLLTLFRLMALDGMRLTDVAARARVTKQAMRETVAAAAARGLVAIAPDAGDRRAQRISFTATGLALLDRFGVAVAAAEASARRALGARRLEGLRAALADFAA